MTDPSMKRSQRADQLTAPATAHQADSKLPPVDQNGEDKAHATIDEKCRLSSVLGLNQIFADVVTLRDMYKDHHLPKPVPASNPLLQVFSRHAQELGDLVYEMTVRIQSLGGICLGMGDGIAGATRIPVIPKGRESIHQISRFVHGHEIILEQSRPMVRETSKYGDVATSTFLVSRVIRITEKQVWYLFDHVIHHAP